MNYIVTQEDIDLLLQQNKVLTYKLEILNKDMKIINSIEGNLINDNLSIDSSSAIRRTYTCQLVVANNSFLIGNNTNVWFDKLIRPFIGIKHQRSQAVKYYCLGTFLYTDLGYKYNCNTNTLSLTCKDLMCILDDTRRGQLDQYKRKLLANTDVRSIIINLLSTIGITKYYIEFNMNGNTVSTYSLPYDLIYEAGTTVYKIIEDLVNMYPGTQMYFDKDGVFNIRKIPTRNDEQSMLTDDILSQIVISENTETSFTEIYNRIIIWGKVNEPNFYSTNVTTSNTGYNVIIAEDKTDSNEMNWITYDSYERGDKISIKVPCTNISSFKLNINNLGDIPVVYENGNPIEANLLDANNDYVFRLRITDNNVKQFVLIGQYQCYAEAYLTNDESDTNLYAVIDKDSKYTIEEIGTITKVLSGSDYDNIYTDTLALARAHKELYENTNLKESLTLNCLCIPFLDVNQKVTYKLKTTNQECDYIVNNISCDNSNFTMNITLNKFYPDYI